MNYRHAFHAGNFADVFKHVILTRILLYLLRKDAPIFFLDTHAGSGEYDLESAEALRTQEWCDGIGRLGEAAPPDDVRELLQSYLSLARRDGAGRLYPGSPVLAQRLLRPQDRLRLNELHFEQAGVLQHALGGDGRVKVTRVDGYAALEASVPPRERRGLVLVDPSFEVAGEWARLETALRKAHRKWPTGIYALWYPIKDRAANDLVVGRFRNGAIERVLRLELLVEAQSRPGAHDALALIGCGMLVVNPPYVLHTEANAILPWLAQVLGRDGIGGWQVEWLAGEGSGAAVTLERPA